MLWINITRATSKIVVGRRNPMNENKVIIRNWQEFKNLVREKKPKAIVFILEQNGVSPNKELTTLRVIMLHEQRYYIFLDFPTGETLRETGIPLHKDKSGIPNLEEDEVKAFLKKQFEKEKIEVYSFWTA